MQSNSPGLSSNYLRIVWHCCEGFDNESVYNTYSQMICDMKLTEKSSVLTYIAAVISVVVSRT